ncbi:hypothetical protein [Sphingomonas turrisvirgatae]|uniref:DUF2946 domain-containing protein n=1 Tax=Sphingomonas turrisvirgatae TaxID=1888892 RepID=A0A1E3LVE5_9SPHN|nr:hypothetical protein [Sphingomonas turrisvirgatae]ODP37714.1 hypothetical protein BFL28_01685 [Sphingomonas turrisvirgatae]
MLRRWLFTLAVVCGLLLAPLAMAGERVADAGTVAASHCADMPDSSAADRDHPAPAKQFRCMGACFGVEVGIARLPDRVAHRRAALALPIMPALAGILIDHEPPPPRPA